MIRCVFRFMFSSQVRKPVVINESDLEWKYIKGGGPGG